MHSGNNPHGKITVSNKKSKVKKAKNTLLLISVLLQCPPLTMHTKEQSCPKTRAQFLSSKWKMSQETDIRNITTEERKKPLHYIQQELEIPLIHKQIRLRQLNSFLMQIGVRGAREERQRNISRILPVVGGRNLC